KLYRAKTKSKDKMIGKCNESYSYLYKYADLVKKTNIGSIVKFGMFICYEASRKGFKEGCRPFIGLDGCHFKGMYGGILL
ncbi:hypothetical protein CFOL_v3_11652, partial [Cephalotus follicularis]